MDSVIRRRIKKVYNIPKDRANANRFREEYSELSILPEFTGLVKALKAEYSTLRFPTGRHILEALLFRNLECSACGVPRRPDFGSRGKPTLCRACCNKDEGKKEKIRRVFELAGGHPMQRPETAAKVKATMARKYGATTTGGSKVLRKKMEETCLKKYGVKSAIASKEVQQKIAKTHQKRGTYTDPNKRERRRARWEATREANAGSNWRELDLKRLVQARYVIKPTVLPDGRILKLQGYEPVAVSWLLSKGFDSNRIYVPESVLYTDKNGEIRHYFPDLAIQRSSWLIEVKSIYTAGLDKPNNRGMFYALRRKSSGVASSGKRLVVLVCDSKKVLGVFKDIHLLSIKEVRSSLQA